jgi:hypothetical protein
MNFKIEKKMNSAQAKFSMRLDTTGQVQWPILAHGALAWHARWCVTCAGRTVTAAMAAAVARSAAPSQRLNCGKVLIARTREVGVPCQTWCRGLRLTEAAQQRWGDGDRSAVAFLGARWESMAEGDLMSFLQVGEGVRKVSHELKREGEEKGAWAAAITRGEGRPRCFGWFHCGEEGFDAQECQNGTRGA